MQVSFCHTGKSFYPNYSRNVKTSGSSVLFVSVFNSELIAIDVSRFLRLKAAELVSDSKTTFRMYGNVVDFAVAPDNSVWALTEDNRLKHLHGSAGRRMFTRPAGCRLGCRGLRVHEFMPPARSIPGCRHSAGQAASKYILRSDGYSRRAEVRVRGSIGRQGQLGPLARTLLEGQS